MPHQKTTFSACTLPTAPIWKREARQSCAPAQFHLLYFLLILSALAAGFLLLSVPDATAAQDHFVFFQLTTFSKLREKVRESLLTMSLGGDTAFYLLYSGCLQRKQQGAWGAWKAWGAGWPSIGSGPMCCPGLRDGCTSHCQAGSVK